MLYQTLLLSLSTLTSVAFAQSYKATFTAYGDGDTFGSGNCNTNSVACGFFDNPGFNAAVSENLFGVTSGQGAGPACGTCWQLSVTGDEKGNPVSGGKSIVVKVNNLCPATGNPLCAQQGMSGTNSMGANVNFDICKNDGASLALFGNAAGGLATGTATKVDCGMWSGSSSPGQLSPATGVGATNAWPVQEKSQAQTQSKFPSQPQGQPQGQQPPPPPPPTYQNGTKKKCRRSPRARRVELSGVM